MRPSALPEGAAPQLPAPGGASQMQLDQPRGVALQAGGEAEFVGSPPEQALGWLAEQPLAAGVDQAQRAGVVKGEHRDVDFSHHALQQRGGFQRAEPPLAQLVHQRVEFEHGEAERVFGARSAGAQRIVLLANRRQHVRKRLQRANHPLAHGEGARQREHRQRDGERPLRAGGEVAGPEQHEGDHQRRQPGDEGEDGDLAFVGGGHECLQPRAQSPEPGARREP